MSSVNVLRNFTSIAVTACCAIGISSAYAGTSNAPAGAANAPAASYSLTDLGVLPDQKDLVSTPAAINSQAPDGQLRPVQMTGTSGKTAFLYTDGKKVPMEDVGKNPDGASRGFGLNAFGDVVGDSTFGQGKVSHAALFSNGTAMDLGTLITGIFSRANSINASGQVVGFSGNRFDGNDSRAFFVDTASLNPQLLDIGTLGGQYAQALAINDSGFVTGNAQIISPSTSGLSHAFIWHSQSKMVDLGTLDGNFSYGTSINANNHIVGYSTINNYDDRVHAFLYYGDKMLDLGSLGGASPDSDRSFALGVNATDQVVGYSYLPMEQGVGSNTPFGPFSVAFVYRKGFMSDLNGLIGAAATNYRLDSATSINDNGQIVAIAFDRSADAYHAVLLTPIASGPAPKTNRPGVAKR